MEEKHCLTVCPRCESNLNPPLKTTGRQICKSCGWSSQARVKRQGSQKPLVLSSTSQFFVDLKHKINYFRNYFQSSKKVRYSAIGLATISLFSSTSVFGYDLYQSNRCKVEARETLSKFAEEWDDTMDRAKNSSRMSMQASISDLQHVKRKINDIDWPKCSLVAKSAIRVGMQSDIDQLLDFMGGDDVTYIESYAWEVYLNEMSEIARRGKTDHRAKSDDDAREILRELYEQEYQRLDKQSDIEDQDSDPLSSLNLSFKKLRLLSEKALI